MPNTESYIYYPYISDIIDIEDIPEFLSFMQGGLENLLNGIHYKDYITYKSIDGSSAFYSLHIISRKRIELEFPGTDIFLILNPDLDDNGLSSFPVTIFWRWEILKYVPNFNLKKFSFSFEDLFLLGLKIFGISEDQALKLSVDIFISHDGESDLRFNSLITDINSFYSSNIDIDEYDDDKYQRLIKELKLLNKNVFQTVFFLYLTTEDPTVTREKVNRFFCSFISSDLLVYVKNILLPKFRATLTLSAALEFPRFVLIPMIAGEHGLEQDNSLNSDGKLKNTYFKFAQTDLQIDTESGIGTQTDLSGTLFPEYSQIGKTSLVIKFTNAKLDLSTTNNISEADSAGYKNDFTGIYIQNATIIINKFGKDDTGNASAAIIGEDLFIGTGGFSGRLTLDTGGKLYRTFGGFKAELDLFSITFRQNAIVESAIAGKLTIPRFKSGDGPAVLNIQAAIRDNGDFFVAVLPEPDLLKITLPDVLELEIHKIELGNVGDRYYIEIGGQLDFIADIPGLGYILPTGILVGSLLIWEDGKLEFSGGGLTLPTSFKLEAGPVKIEVEQITTSAYNKEYQGVPRSYTVIGFDGLINAGIAGIGAYGNGIKYYFTNDFGEGKPFNHFLHTDAIGIDITVPPHKSKDNAIFTLNGYLSSRNERNEYTGSVSFAIPKLKISGSAGISLNPDIPAFLVDVGLELPNPMPLGATGLGIYAMRGLLGQHYMPAKSAAGLDDTATWWDYYKAKSRSTGREGIAIDKFASEKGFSIGAGLSLSTTFDGGRVFSSKLFLLLGLPDVFLIQGQAGILRKRIGLMDEVDPPFSALIIVGDNSVRANLGVNFNIPESDPRGAILQLQGALDMAFYFNNASGWYINIGKDSPESERVRAEILTLFKGYAYLMLSSRGIRAGAGARFDFNKKFGPVKFGLGAYIDLGGYISFKPIQIGGFIQVGGYAYIKVFKFKLGLSVALALAAEAPHPFQISGKLEIRINLPWPFKDIKLKVDFSWTFNKNRGPLEQPVAILELPDPLNGYLPAAAVNILTNENFSLAYVNSLDPAGIPPPHSGWQIAAGSSVALSDVVVPLDSYIDIELLKPVKPGNFLGGTGNQAAQGYQELLPPQKGKSDQVQHEYELTGLEIKFWSESDNAWLEYNVYEAVTAIVLANTTQPPVPLAALKPGYWQFMENGRFNRIRLLSQHMFSYTALSSSSVSDLDGRNFRTGDIFCLERVRREKKIDWLSTALNTSYSPGLNHLVKGSGFIFTGISASVKTGDNGKRGLQILAKQGTLAISFPVPVAWLDIDFGNNSNSVSISYVDVVYKPSFFKTAKPIGITRATRELARNEQHQVVNYNDAAKPFDSLLLVFNKDNTPDYEGELIIGGHFDLPEEHLPPGSAGLYGSLESWRGILSVVLYNRSFTSTELRQTYYTRMSGLAGRWLDDAGSQAAVLNKRLISGAPEEEYSWYGGPAGGKLQKRGALYFSSDQDAVVVPFTAALKVENDSFSFGLTAIFNPFEKGTSTLLYKVAQDPANGNKKGFALHLVNTGGGDAATVYNNAAALPHFSLIFSAYDGTASQAISANGSYTYDCSTSRLKERQYKQIFISVNRLSDTLDIYIDRILKASAPIPAALAVVFNQDTFTFIKQLIYIAQQDYPVTQSAGEAEEWLNQETQLLDNGINKLLQPVWRPDTTYAVKLSTLDKVKGNSAQRHHVFGFRTAGPVGHFHEKSSRYQELKNEGRESEFKLARLEHYIDYEHSNPDAQGRLDLSKPVFYTDAQVRLFFTKAYVNTMYANWDTYKGLPAIESELKLELINPQGIAVERSLEWDPEREVVINQENMSLLPPDLRTLYLLNQAAYQNGCKDSPDVFKKRIRQGAYHFPQLLPATLYTALFSSVYKTPAEEKSIEVHKYAFMTSRYSSFEEQLKSFILNDEPGKEEYAIGTILFSATPADINERLLAMINENENTANPDDSLKYKGRYDRILYGGLAIKQLPAPGSTFISLLLNMDPVAPGQKQLLGILIRNPEPFNDPKLTEELRAGTAELQLRLPDETELAPDSFIYIHSADTSGVLITNAAMNIPAGLVSFRFRYRMYNGIDYHTLYQEYESPQIDIRPYL